MVGTKSNSSTAASRVGSGAMRASRSGSPGALKEPVTPSLVFGPSTLLVKPSSDATAPEESATPLSMFSASIPLNSPAACGSPV